MTKLLSGQVALVTGAGRGIGREIAIALADAGAKVVVNDIGAALDGGASGETPAEEVVAVIRAAGGEAVADMHSVSETATAEAMVAAAVASFGRLDIVVNNAGILRDRMIWKMSAQDWDSVLKVHLYGSFNVSAAAARLFRAQEGGVFLHMISTSGLVGNIGQANYAAAKMGVAGLSRSIALDMARFGVRSNCIAPFATTRMVASIPGTQGDEFLSRNREMSAAKVAPLAVFLAGAKAADVSGQIFLVRGNEISLMSQPRPLRTFHTAEGWAADTIADRVLPALRGDLVPLETTMDYFSWDTV